MKIPLVYFGVLAGGAVAGATGMGAYNAIVVGVPAEEVVVSESEAPTEGETLGSEPAAGGADGGGAGSDAEAAATDEVPAPPETGSAPGADVAAGSGVTEVPAEPVVADADSVARMALGFQSLARIFSAMQPEDAAAVLELLDDAQLEGILLAMQSRNAAPILAEMEPVRGASLSRRVLEGGP